MANQSTRTEPRLAALYARQSKADPDGIDRQLPRLRNLARERGWTVVAEYVDDGFSAAKSRGPGSDWARMLADAQAGKVDTVIAVDLDRLLRGLPDLLVLIEHKLMAVTISGEIDLTSADGEFRATILAAVARFEVRRKAERQSRGQLQRAQQGRAPKGVRPLGYATSGDVIEDEAAVVHEMFRLFAVQDGPSIASIAKGLSGRAGPKIPSTLPHLPKRSRALAMERNERLIAEGKDPVPVPPDGPWDSSTVLGILHNPRYAGYSVYTDRNDRETKNKRRTWHAQILRDENGEPVMGQWAPIVEPETWWRVQERLNEPERITNKSGSTAREHIGSGLYVCGICDRPVRSSSDRYTCLGHVTRKRVHIDDWVLRIVRARLARPDLADAMPMADEPRLQAIAAEISSRQARLLRAQHDYDAELIEAYDLKRTRDRENTAIASLEAERRSLTATTDLGGVLDAKDPVAAFDAADLMLKRRVIDFFCVVRLRPHPRGRKGFDPATVDVLPKPLGRG